MISDWTYFAILEVNDSMNPEQTTEAFAEKGIVEISEIQHLHLNRFECQVKIKSYLEDALAEEHWLLIETEHASLEIDE